MSTNFTKRTLFSGVLIASSLATMVYAEPPKEGFTVTPSIGLYNADGDRQAGDDNFYSIGIGYQTNSPLAVEAVVLHSDANKSGQNHNLNQYRLDALYALPEFTTIKLTPYVAAGVGVNDIGGTDSSTHLLVNAGGGVQYALNQDVNLRADYRLVKDLKDHYLDSVMSVGVQYSFGLPENK
ncbi:porin family protein [Marinomonas colpomeniae]|uniref:Porin family protein n=1 Tax=Marinomonas colpomeniae TaxID=2774408 RepID=A0ABR8NXR0_9GAMM|nr:porin family protein [Marinomonas colpomeniae]MBD5770810.1 porin family protein [Marinomonas colpomeniae]